jgi:CubicO group peptidase (beta-lactamase class C family)
MDDKVSDYIPEMKGSAYDDVSIRQLLTMTSGVKWNEDYADPNADVAPLQQPPDPSPAWTRW